MDTRLLRHYENELAFLQDMGAEFAEAFPKIAARTKRRRNPGTHQYWKSCLKISDKVDSQCLARDSAISTRLARAVAGAIHMQLTPFFKSFQN